jgi:hypothetical protein
MDLPPIAGGSRQQREILRRILASLGQAGIEQVRIRPPAKAWRPFQPGDVNLVFTLADRRDLRSQWKANLAAGAFSDRSLELGLPRLIAVVIVGEGSYRLAGPKPADDRPSGIPVTTGDDAASMATAVREAADAAVVEIEALETITPLAFAVAVTIRSGDPARFLEDRALVFNETLGKFWTDYDGIYVEAVDANGKRFWLTAYASRARVGMGWIRPDLAGCDPFPHSQPAGYEPPPCPAG